MNYQLDVLRGFWPTFLSSVMEIITILDIIVLFHIFNICLHDHDLHRKSNSINTEIVDFRLSF